MSRYRLIRHGHFFRKAATLDEARAVAREASRDTEVCIHDDGEEALRKYGLIETWRPARTEKGD